MRRFFLILLALSMLALVLAQPSMRQTARHQDVSAPISAGGDDPQLPEILATNMPDGDTLIGLKPLPTDSLTAWSERNVESEASADSLSNDTISTTGPTVTETADLERLPKTGEVLSGTEPADSIAGDNEEELDDDREGLTRINRDKVDLENGVAFSAKDSVVLVGTNLAFLYGDGEVEYGSFKLNAEEIRMVMDSTTVYANGRVDSVGEIQGKPVFQDGGDTYESKTMSYNFKNQRGFITDIITEQGEGYLTGGRAKKMADGSFFSEDAMYTTCDEHDHPHFYIKLTRGKIRPGKDVVSGAAYMVVADVPLPIALPFGYFPFSKEYSSGIIFPTFGDDYNRGFYARNGGYYFAFSDYVDLAVTGEIYTKGSWGITGRSSYRKRYKYNGSFNISYLTSVYGDKGLPDYTKQNNFQVVWSHSMDTKSNPNMSFSASVNFSTSGYTRNDLNSYYNSNSFTENTKSSTVNMTYRFPGTKWAASASMNISQRTQDSTLAVSFPNLNVTLSQVAPFKRKKAVGSEKWYEKIKLSYSGQFQNSLTAQQNVFFKKSLIKDWRNGLRHSVPVSATFSVLKYINVSPSLSMTDRMYTSKIKRDWDPNRSAEVLDTCYGFYNLFDFSASLSADTKLYGFFKPMKFLGDKVQMIRHVMTPSLSYSYTPDFSAPMWGVYGQYSYTNNAGQVINRKYSYFQHGVFGSPGQGMSSAVSLSLSNNLEMKVKSDQDSTGVKKISLIENLSLSQSYNFAADSMNWSNLNTSILLRLTKSFNLNLSATWDPYTYALNANGQPVRVNRTRLQAHKGWVKLTSTGTSFSYTFNNSTFKRKKDNKETQKGKKGDDYEDDYDEGEDGMSLSEMAPSRKKRGEDPEDKTNDADGYTPWDCPWSLTFNYSINYGLGTFNYDKMDYNGRFTQNLSVSGNIRPTKNWNFSMSCSYDFQAKKIAYMSCNISRDMHCFTMSCSIIPVGVYKSFNFNVAVKSSLLSDLKYDKQSSRLNGINW